MALANVQAMMKDLHDSFLRFESHSLSPSQFQIINDIDEKLAEISQLVVQLDASREPSVKGAQVGVETAAPPGLVSGAQMTMPSLVFPDLPAITQTGDAGDSAVADPNVPPCMPVNDAVSDAVTPLPIAPTNDANRDTDAPRLSSDTDSVPVIFCSTAEWRELPQVLNRACQLGAKEFGAFKAVLDVTDSWHVRQQGHVRCMEYAAEAQANGTYQIRRKETRQKLLWSEMPTVDVESILKEQMHHLENGMPGVFYRTDVRATTKTQRHAVGLTTDSLVWPLRGNKLEETTRLVDGIHTPYFYQSGPAPGAVFAMHIEDAKLYSINVLYKGRKVWIIIPPRARTQLEQRLREDNPNARCCSQFVRHLSVFIPVSKLTEWGIPFFIIDQRAGDAIITFEDTYHQGICVGSTAAEAINYAAKDWNVEDYIFCSHACPAPQITEKEFTLPTTDASSSSALASRRKIAPRGRDLRLRLPLTQRVAKQEAPRVQDAPEGLSCSLSMHTCLFAGADEKYQRALGDAAAIQTPQKARVLQLIMQCSVQRSQEAVIEHGPSQTQKVILRIVKNRQNITQYTLSLRYDYMQLASIFTTEVNRVTDRMRSSKAIRRREANYGLRSRRKRGKSGNKQALESMLGCAPQMSPSDLLRCVRWGECLTKLCTTLGSQCLATFPGTTCIDLAASFTTGQSHFPDLSRPIAPEEYHDLLEGGRLEYFIKWYQMLRPEFFGSNLGEEPRPLIIAVASA